jgi:hypothetical protein
MSWDALDDAALRDILNKDNDFEVEDIDIGTYLDDVEFDTPSINPDSYQNTLPNFSPSTIDLPIQTHPVCLFLTSHNYS